jgi:hypothetical protein
LIADAYSLAVEGVGFQHHQTCGVSLAMQFVRKYLLKLLGRSEIVPRQLNRIFDIGFIDGNFCLIFDHRVYDPQWRLIRAAQDTKADISKPVLDAVAYQPKDLIRFHLTDGSTLTVCPSLGLHVRIKRLP